MFVFLFARASHRSITTRLDAIERRGRGDAKRNVRFRIVSKSTSADLESVGPQTNRRGTSRRNTLAGIVRVRKKVQSLGKIDIVCGDITKLEIDVIVNAANTTLLGGGGLMARFTVLPGLNYSQNAERSAVVSLGKRKSRADIICLPASSFTPSGRSGTAGNMKRLRHWQIATGIHCNLQWKTESRPSRFRRSVAAPTAIRSKPRRRSR